MTLARLIERAIIEDLNHQPRIAQFPIQFHDNAGSKSGDQPIGGQPADFVITVTARETGGWWGTIIKRMAVEIELRQSINADQTLGNLLDEIEGVVTDQIQVDYVVLDPVSGTQPKRLTELSSAQHQVIGIIPGPVTRSESNLERIRVVNRTFIATLLF